jgi:hypothetical protein
LLVFIAGKQTGKKRGEPKKTYDRGLTRDRDSVTLP